ncbi:MAG: long-chain fatty acid--CoA ligase [Betaproteobacteria bacterium]|nr:long-chain fatty acid--CoA ligase [Betaproteobacteria bacterium]
MNVADHVQLAALRTAQHPAIVFEGSQIAYAALNDCAAALARALLLRGVKRGDRVALYLPNIPAFALVYLAVLRAGAVAVSINAIFKSEEVKFIINDSGAGIIFTVADLLPHIPRDDCPLLDQVVICEGTADLPNLKEWLELGASVPLKCTRMKPDDPAALLYSSGTTGVPKGVTLSHRNVQSNVRTTAACAGMRPADRLIVFLPLFHVFAQNFIMNGAFESGATVVLHRRFVPDQVIDSIARDKVTMFFGVPTIYIALLSAGVAAEKLASVRYFFSAAATMPQEISRRWTESYRQLVYEGYGLTECAPCAAYNHVTKHKFGSVGTAIEDFEVRIFDENDKEVARGEWGEIVIRGPGVMKGYWGNPQETARALRTGWLHSGDIGRQDEEGYVFIVDRVKDMINVSGFKVWPAEVEHYLYQIPGIKEVAVYGVPDPVKGEVVRVAAVLGENAALTGEDIGKWCREKLAAYKAPAQVDIVAELPKSATGKILKRVLRDNAIALSSENAGKAPAA